MSSLFACLSQNLSCYRKQYPTAGAALTKSELLCSRERETEGVREKEGHKDSLHCNLSLSLSLSRFVSRAIVYLK